MVEFHTGVTVEAIQTGYSNIADQVKAMLKAIGLELPGPPKKENGEVDNVELPPDLTILNSDELGKIYGKLNAAAGWVESQRSLADSQRTALDSARDKIFARLRLIKEGDPSEKTDQAKVDPLYITADQKVIVAECYFSMIDAILKRYNKDLRLVSRELTRRGQEIDHFSREQSITSGKTLLRHQAKFRK
jgi:hypothetical protein